MAFITTDDGTRLYYEAFGAGEKTIVFVHGLMDSGQSFKTYAGELAERYRIVVYDQRAHGQSDVPDDGYTMACYAKDLRALIEQLALTNIVLIGYSMGVHVIFDYIQQFGEDGIDKFVFTVMSPRLINDETYALGMKGGFSYQEAIGTLIALNGYFDAACMQSAALYEGSEEAKVRVAHFYEDARKLKSGPMIRLNIALIAGDYRSMLDKISKPALVIAGENDLYPVAAHEAVHAQLHRSKLTIVPDCGHMLLMERPDIYREAISDFIDNFD